MKVYYNNEDKRTVTAFYYDIILEALRKRGAEIVHGDGYNNPVINALDRKKDYILFTEVKYLPNVLFKGFKNLIFWYQGTIPDEDYMNFHKLWRKWAFVFLEGKTLQKVKYNIGVSRQLFEHFDNVHGKGWRKEAKTFVMPCFNIAHLDKDAFFTPGKYTNNIFAYTGSMASWQCFDKIAKVYSEVEKRRPDVFFKVLTKSDKEAEAIIKKYGIKNYSVYGVSSDKVAEEISPCKFGFILREYNIVNNVATPTKFGNYLASGLIPIYTNATRSFAEMGTHYHNTLCVDYDNAVDKICGFMKRHINPEEVYGEYSEIFKTYYGRDKYVKELTDWFIDM